MSVLIKGMEMPKGCFYDEPPYHCPFYDCLKCTALNAYAAARPYNYLPDCPLIEVKTPHGRLIDADKAKRAFAAAILGEAKEDGLPIRATAYEVGTVINGVPTVIESEE